MCYARGNWNEKARIAGTVVNVIALSTVGIFLQNKKNNADSPVSKNVEESSDIVSTVPTAVESKEQTDNKPGSTAGSSRKDLDWDPTLAAGLRYTIAAYGKRDSKLWQEKKIREILSYGAFLY